MVGVRATDRGQERGAKPHQRVARQPRTSSHRCAVARLQRLQVVRQLRQLGVGDGLVVLQDGVLVAVCERRSEKRRARHA